MSKAGWGAMGTAVLLTTFGAAWLAAAPGRPAGPMHGQRGGAGRLAQYLGLTDEQRASWQEIEKKHREEMKPLHEQGRELHQKLRTALEAQSPDAKSVGEAAIALHAHREKMRASREGLKKRLAELLTPEQKEKLEAFEAARASMGPALRGRGGRGRGRGPAQDIEG